MPIFHVHRAICTWQPQSKSVSQLSFRISICWKHCGGKKMLDDFYFVFVTNEPQVNLKNRLQIVEQIKCEMK